MALKSPDTGSSPFKARRELVDRFLRFKSLFLRMSLSHRSGIGNQSGGLISLRRRCALLRDMLVVVFGITLNAGPQMSISFQQIVIMGVSAL
ncbi:MAG: hypothetical protein J0H18_16300 [Rhizobiales bacterium]|nr:hypothetical protein [Hyphomicrobiales bacterium]